MKTTLPALKKLFNENRPRSNKYAYLIMYMRDNSMMPRFDVQLDPLKFRVEKLAEKLKIDIVYTSFFAAYKKYKTENNIE